MSKQHTNLWKTEYTRDFDYDNVDPETLKEWETELRRKDQRDMRKYLKQKFPDATLEEKKALRIWVRSGHVKKCLTFAVTVCLKMAGMLLPISVDRWISLVLCAFWRKNTRAIWMNGRIT